MMCSFFWQPLSGIHFRLRWFVVPLGVVDIELERGHTGRGRHNAFCCSSVTLIGFWSLLSVGALWPMACRSNSTGCQGNTGSFPVRAKNFRCHCPYMNDSGHIKKRYMHRIAFGDIKQCKCIYIYTYTYMYTYLDIYICIHRHWMALIEYRRQKNTHDIINAT